MPQRFFLGDILIPFIRIYFDCSMHKSTNKYLNTDTQEGGYVNFSRFYRRATKYTIHVAYSLHLM